MTEIRFDSFNSCRSLTDIEFPESLTEITEVWYNWNTGVTEIPFDGTPWLEAKRAENPLVIVNDILIDGRTCSRKVEIPDGVTKICSCVFSNCTTITSVTIPSSVEKIGEAAFYGCERLTEIVLPDSVSYIGNYALYNCTALENVTFPNNTVEMGSYIFEKTPWLKKKTDEEPLLIINGNLINGAMCKGDVVIPDSVKSIAPGAFYSDHYCDVESVKLPDGITKIPDYLFYYCTKLKSVTIPDSVTEIGNYAFEACESLQSITLPNGLKKIGSDIFRSSWHGSVFYAVWIHRFVYKNLLQCHDVYQCIHQAKSLFQSPVFAVAAIDFQDIGSGQREPFKIDFIMLQTGVLLYNSFAMAVKIHSKQGGLSSRIYFSVIQYMVP